MNDGLLCGRKYPALNRSLAGFRTTNFVSQLLLPPFPVVFSPADMASDRSCTSLSTGKRIAINYKRFELLLLPLECNYLAPSLLKLSAFWDRRDGKYLGSLSINLQTALGSTVPFFFHFSPVSSNSAQSLVRFLPFASLSSHVADKRLKVRILSSFPFTSQDQVMLFSRALLVTIGESFLSATNSRFQQN